MEVALYARAIAFTVGILVKHGTAARRQCKEPRWLRVRALRSKTRKVEGHTDMSAIPAPQRIELTLAVRAILGSRYPKVSTPQTLPALHGGDRRAGLGWD